MHRLISKIGLALCLQTLNLFILPSTTAVACEVNSTQLATIQSNELRYLENRIPPAFKHALEDKLFKLSTSLTADCFVHMQATIDPSALSEANQTLNENPAKRIMLSSQGYALPDSESLDYEFKVDASLQAIHADTLQTSALGKARASIEMVYSIVTQNRASMISESQQNNLPWSTAYNQRFIDQCIRLQKSNQVNSLTCECRANALAKHLNERQMEYSDYIRSNPYAKATGADKGFSALEQKVGLACQG